MPAAVLFDWGDTLIRFVYDEALVEAGHRAGLAALGRDDLPEVERVATHFRERYEPLFWAPGTVEELEYPGLVRQLLGDFGLEVDDEELTRFLEAEHAAWDPARQAAANTPALLEALRARGLKLGLVSNAYFAVFSSEVGKRKPHPAIFERALDALGVAAADSVFVGDRLYEDVRGAGELGMTTVQALWFRADEHPEGGEPDFQAFTQMDVLNVVDRLAAAA